MLNGVAEGIVLALFGWALLRVIGQPKFQHPVRGMVLHAGGDSRVPSLGSRAFAGSGALASTTHFALQLPGSGRLTSSYMGSHRAAGLAKIGFGFWQLRRLRHSCAVMDPAILDPVLRDTLAQFGTSRHVTICTSDRVRIPAAIGFLKPAIIFPPWVLQDLSPLELNAVLLHELAHLRRWDDWTNLAQEIMRALFFFIQRSGGSDVGCRWSGKWPATILCWPVPRTPGPMHNVWYL